MPLVDHEIREAIKAGEIKIDQFDADLINPNSLDVCLGNKFTELLSNDMAWIGGDWVPYINPLKKSTFTFETTEAKYYDLMPGGFVLGCLLENITLSDNICAEIRGKSSLGRLGLINSAHAGWIDAGWSGVLTIELSNVAHHPIQLTPGMKIGQIIFHRTEVVEKSYSITGRYSNQQAGFGSLGI